ncbi:MAG: MFS transporter [Anaerolineae bacterium]
MRNILFLMRNRALATVTLGHFSVDMFSGMLPLILLGLTDPLNMSYVQVGIVASTFTFTSSLTQPFFGWLADRLGGRWLAAGGILLIAVMTGLMRSAPSYWALLLLAPLAGIGSAAFHPQGAANASIASGKQRATGMSIFMLGGNIGYAIGPVVARVLFAAIGGVTTLALVVLGALLSAAQLVFGPHVRRLAGNKGPATAGLNDYRPMAPLAVAALIWVIFLRMWVNSAITTYLPQLTKASGFDIDYSSNLQFSILFPLAFGGLIGGSMSDRIGRRPIIVGSLLLAAPLLILVLLNLGPRAYIFAPFLGVMIGASFPITLVMAQELLPKGIGLMSGLALGFTFIAGAIGVAISGWMADHIGLMPMLFVMAVLLLIASAIALLLPGKEHQIADGRIPQPVDAQPVEA